MSDEPVEPKKPFWKNPFLIAFVLGAVVLTVLPFMQRRFLTAPPPLRSLGSWQLHDRSGAAFGSQELAGKVWIASFAPEPCLDACQRHQAEFGVTLEHVEDLKTPVMLVTFALPSSEDGGSSKALAALAKPGRWAVLEVTQPQVLDSFHEAFAGFVRATDAGSNLGEFIALRPLALVDQTGALRGFWKDDETGRGNIINAARLLARYGPKP